MASIRRCRAKAATIQLLPDGRFILGLDAGENLDEHIVGGQWPLARLRHKMLGEAVEIILAPWEGGMMTHHGKYLEVESAKVCDLPSHRPANGYRGLRAGRGVQR